MFHKEIKTKADAIKYLKSANRAPQILERLDELSVILGEKQMTIMG